MVQRVVRWHLQGLRFATRGSSRDPSRHTYPVPPIRQRQDNSKERDREAFQYRGDGSKLAVRISHEVLGSLADVQISGMAPGLRTPRYRHEAWRGPMAWMLTTS